MVIANKTRIMKTAFREHARREDVQAAADGANGSEINIADLKFTFNAQSVAPERGDVSTSRKDLRAIPDLVRKLR